MLTNLTEAEKKKPTVEEYYNSPIDLGNYEEPIQDFIDKDTADYQVFMQALQGAIAEDVDNRKDLVPFGKDTYMSKGNLLTLLELVQIFNTDKGLKFDIDLFEGVNIRQPDTYEDYYNALLFYLTNEYGDRYTDLEVSEYLSDVRDNLTTFTSEHVLFQKGSTISMFDIIEMYNRYPRLKELMEYDGSEEGTNRVDKLNAVQAAHKKEAIDIIMNDKVRNPYREFVDSKSGINLNQFVEVFLTIMFKPDSFGNVISLPIFTSFAKGLNSVIQYYIDCIGARTALITSKTQVRKSGYFNRRLSSLTSDERIDLNVDDCGTQHYVMYNVQSKDKLKAINGRYYKDDDGNLQVVNADKDTDLVGEVLDLRSPIMCALNGDRICKTCYGKLWKRNAGLGVGTIATLLTCEPFTQKLLSTKHLLKVEVDDINLPNNFSENFSLAGNKIAVTNNNWIILYAEDLAERENRSIDKYSISVVHIEDIKGEDTVYEFEQKLVLEDFLARNLNKFYDDKKQVYKFRASDLADEYIFKFLINNKGVADPLMKVKNALEKNAYIESVRYDYNMVLNYILDNLHDSKTSIDSIHIEMILRQMLFIDNDVLFDRTEFRKVNLQYSYKMLNVSDAILQSNSVSKSLSYQFIYKQLMTESYSLFRKNGTSEFDTFMQ